MKNKKILIVLIVSVIAAIAAAALVIGLIVPHRTTVYAFRGNYPAGTVIEGNMLTPIQIDSKVIAAGGSSSADVFFVTKENIQNIRTGETLMRDVKKGEPFLLTDISSKGGTDIEVRMSDDNVAITIGANSITGVTPNLKPECRVNAYISYPSNPTIVLQENLRVLAVQKEENNLTGVTVEVRREDAAKFIESISSGKVYLGLVRNSGK